MQIILVHPGLRQARSITLKMRHVVALLAFFLSLVLAACAGVVYFGWPYLARAGLPVVAQATAAPTDSAQRERNERENIAAMAVKVGEMQAQMMRLDALGERVSGLAGIKPETFNFRDKPGRGGIEPAAATGDAMTLAELGQALDRIARQLEQRSDYLNVVETTLMRDKVEFKMLPTVQPVNISYNASGFGLRIDPINGRSAFHTGIDFPGPTGTPVVAAAGGVVVAAEYHPQYGNMLELDHGNDVVTRYAHASRLHVKLGDIVKRGQRVADIGSTGRSTGAHLHFEVLVKNVHQDPHKFLSAGAQAQAKLLSRNR
ncbi:MAG: family metallopeptidase [Paucimonas sp.]|nr:family metallopeptidase [Paucimonas sp.]